MSQFATTSARARSRHFGGLLRIVGTAPPLSARTPADRRPAGRIRRPCAPVPRRRSRSRPPESRWRTLPAASRARPSRSESGRRRPRSAHQRLSDILHESQQLEMAAQIAVSVRGRRIGADHHQPRLRLVGQDLRHHVAPRTTRAPPGSACAGSCPGTASCAARARRCGSRSATVSMPARRPGCMRAVRSRQKRRQVVLVRLRAHLDAVRTRAACAARSAARADIRSRADRARQRAAHEFQAAADRLEVDVVLEQHAGNPPERARVLAHVACIRAAARRRVRV